MSDDLISAPGPGRKGQLLWLADFVRRSYKIGAHVQNQLGTWAVSDAQKDLIEQALREAAERDEAAPVGHRHAQ